MLAHSVAQQAANGGSTCLGTCDNKLSETMQVLDQYVHQSYLLIAALLFRALLSLTNSNIGLISYKS